MLMNIKETLKKTNAFTMIELIIVIAIIGILVGIAIPRLSGFTNTAEIRAEETTKRNIEGAAIMYMGEYGQDEYNDIDLVEAGYFDSEDLMNSRYNGVVDISSNGTVTVKEE